MTKAELVKKVSLETGVPQKDVANVMKAIFAGISVALKAGESIAINDFGTFSVAEHAARKGRNPQTGEEIQIPASRGAKLKQAKALKELLNS